MRILFCNKYNYPFSGTEVYLFELMELLRSHGHEVALFSMADPRGEVTRYDKYFVPHIDFKDRRRLWEIPRMAAHAIYSTEARRRLRGMISEFRPDIAHVRNIYHHLSPSILWELKQQGIPIVYHVNDFKLLCPSYNLVSGGEACERCKGGSFRRMLTSKCYPGFGARMNLVAEAYVHRWLGTYRKCVDRFLAPSQFVRDKFAEHGWDAGKFDVLPHFQRLSSEQITKPARGTVLYVGRLSSEKGVGDLLDAMQSLPEVRLVIAGDGPSRKSLEERVVRLQLRNVTFLGQVTAEERDRLIGESLFTVMPSHAYETFGKTILESYAMGRAVIASDRGSRRELVHDGKTGLLYRCGDAQHLSRTIEWMIAHPDAAAQMGREGRELVVHSFTPEEHYERMTSLYRKLISAREIRRKRVSSARDPQTIPTAAQPKRLRIAFIGGRGVVSKYSGIEAYYEEVGSRLASMGHEVTVYCRNYFTPALSQHQGMKLVLLPTWRTKHFETVIHTLLSSAHSLVKGYDIVHYHALGPALFSSLPRMVGAKTLVTVQGLDWQRKKWGRLASRVLRVGEQASVRLPNCTMVVSRTLQNRYRDLHGTECAYVPNGGVLRERSTPNKIIEWGLTPGGYVLFLGRFSPEKGCHVLVDAFEKVERDATLVMAGASSYCDGYSRELRKHASDRIRMLDWVSGPVLDELLTNAMIFVLPSDMEGLSLALLDAMGARVCVLASDIPENREAVEGAGFTFRCGDSEDLADRISFLLANPAIREAAGNAGRRRIEQVYSWDKIAANIEECYFQTLGLPKDGAVPRKPVGRAERPQSESPLGRRAG